MLQLPVQKRLPSRCAVPYPEDTTSRTFLLPGYRSSVHHVLFRACSCDTHNSKIMPNGWIKCQKRHLVCSASAEHWWITVPLLREVIRGVVGLEMDPLPGGQVQPVQIGAVDVTRCTSKDIQEAVYDDHCLEKRRKYVKLQLLYPYLF